MSDDKRKEMPTDKARDIARKEFDKGSSPKTTRDRIDTERRQENIKPVEPRK